MKKCCRSLMILGVMIAGVMGGAKAWADTSNFYFEDFTGDYYLSKAEDGTSRLHVKETLTAVFSETNQNHGIERYIPFTNQGGANRTVADYAALNLKVTRNGNYEPVSNMGVENNYFYVRIGDTGKYVQGKQVYVLEYDFANVVTEFDAAGKNVSGQNVEKIFQELYWDTNGTGWVQRFDKVTARVHFMDGVMDGFTGESWCYVGRYGESGQDRCSISKIDDGVEFTTSGVKSYENLTFDIEFKAGSFVVFEPVRNYILVWTLVILGLILLLITIVLLKGFIKIIPKWRFYREYFVKPEYQPNEDYTVAEMAEVYIGKTKDKQVAILLDLIVKKKVALLKIGEKRKKGWKIKILSLDGVEPEAKTMLTILNGGVDVDEGDEVEIRTQTATSKLVVLGNKFNREIVGELEDDGLVEGKYNTDAGRINFGQLFLSSVVVAIIIVVIFAKRYDDMIESGETVGILVGKDWFPQTTFLMVFVAFNVFGILHYMTRKYEVRTKKGLVASRYLDGAKLYIRMAESDRLKMLQSVKGVDTSKEGVVRLYEKMLPYAVLLGLEGSWMAELEKYYKMKEVTEPEWHRSGFTVRDMYYVSTLASMYSRSSTTMSSGSGGSSSGFSGGGGGGFSGGGGGGGGGGGW